MIYYKKYTFGLCSYFWFRTPKIPGIFQSDDRKTKVSFVVLMIPLGMEAGCRENQPCKNIQSSLLLSPCPHHQPKTLWERMGAGNWVLSPMGKDLINYAYEWGLHAMRREYGELLGCWTHGDVGSRMPGEGMETLHFPPYLVLCISSIRLFLSYTLL